MQTQHGLRCHSKIAMQTLRRTSRANWVDLACISALRDQITTIPWSIMPIAPHLPYDEGFREVGEELLHKPNANKENGRTFIDKTVEAILSVDAGVWEKVRNRQGQVIELWQRDGASIKCPYDEHGLAGDPAYQQVMVTMNGQVSPKPVAEWSNDDTVYIVWNPMGTVDQYGTGYKPGFVRQNSIPPVIINLGKDLDSSQVDRFQAFLAAEMVGPEGSTASPS